MIIHVDIIIYYRYTYTPKTILKENPISIACILQNRREMRIKLK